MDTHEEDSSNRRHPSDRAGSCTIRGPPSLSGKENETYRQSSGLSALPDDQKQVEHYTESSSNVRVGSESSEAVGTDNCKQPSGRGDYHADNDSGDRDEDSKKAEQQNSHVHVDDVDGGDFGGSDGGSRRVGRQSCGGASGQDHVFRQSDDDKSGETPAVSSPSSLRRPRSPITADLRESKADYSECDDGEGHGKLRPQRLSLLSNAASFLPTVANPVHAHLDALVAAAPWLVREAPPDFRLSAMTYQIAALEDKLQQQVMLKHLHT